MRWMKPLQVIPIHLGYTVPAAWSVLFRRVTYSSREEDPHPKLHRKIRPTENESLQAVIGKAK